jgi:hypothetical protein
VTLTLPGGVGDGFAVITGLVWFVYCDGLVIVRVVVAGPITAPLALNVAVWRICSVLALTLQLTRVVTRLRSSGWPSSVAVEVESEHQLVVLPWLPYPSRTSSTEHSVTTTV